MFPEGSPTRSRECPPGGRWGWGTTGSQKARNPCSTEGERGKSGTECVFLQSIHIKNVIYNCSM